jgi:ATP/maltotriose-dependent transcriptional regulator MalT
VQAAGITGDLLERGRASSEAAHWQEAYDSLSAAAAGQTLVAADLELLAVAASMIGRDSEWLSHLERAHYAYLEAGDTPHAVRCAFWIGVRLARGGEIGRATGWLSRARRLLDQQGHECVEDGFLLLPQVFEHEALGEIEAAEATAGRAADIGQRYRDADLLALATHEQGRLLIRLGRVKDGLARLDEAMVTVSSGGLAPYVTGIVYCGTIAACQEVYEVRRAREWTAALSAWCDEQPGLLSFTGNCLIHRAEILQLDGEWNGALEEARRAGERLTMSRNEGAAGEASYRAGELLRLRGMLEQAEAAYREASRCGFEPQPGLALLRLAQGRGDAAAAAIRRAIAEQTEQLRCARLLPAAVEILLAMGEPDEAAEACTRLEEIATGFQSGMLLAMAAHARGAVDLAAGDPRSALLAARRAVTTWLELGAPYGAACARVLVALACRDVGDDDAASLELEAARDVFSRLGAIPDLAWLDSLAPAGAAPATHGLTQRELEVLRLVAAGLGNRAIASQLVISEHTVARHLQNIFAKLGVPSRTAATAFAFEHDLV